MRTPVALAALAALWVAYNVVGIAFLDRRVVPTVVATVLGVVVLALLGRRVRR